MGVIERLAQEYAVAVNEYIIKELQRVLETDETEPIKLKQMLADKGLKAEIIEMPPQYTGYDKVKANVFIKYSKIDQGAQALFYFCKTY